MPPISVSNFDKAAVLLHRLDPASLDKVMAILGPDFAGKIRPVLAAVSRRKDLGALTDQVLQEFRELQQEVRASISDAPNLQKLQSASEPGATSNASAGPASDEQNAGSTEHKELQSDQASEETDSISKIPAAVLAAALKKESPRMIAMVLKQLPAEVSGKSLEALPPELRQEVFLLMAEQVQVNPLVVQRVMQRLIEVCQTVDPATVEEQDRRIKTLIGILQSVEREERNRLLETLTERDPELAAQIDDLMYDYTDVLRLEDRSVQKLLGQLEQKIVAMALKTAPEDLRQKVLKNLSERVRLALNEEMELLPTVTAAKADQARREIANAIRGLDKEGNLIWLE